MTIDLSDASARDIARSFLNNQANGDASASPAVPVNKSAGQVAKPRGDVGHPFADHPSVVAARA